MNRLDVPFPVYPLGLDYVAGSLPDHHKARILDLSACPVGQEEPVVREALRDFPVGAVGVSIRNIDNTDLAELKSFLGDMRAAVDAIRRVTNAPIILGGAGYTLFPEELLTALGADYGIVGEGERLGLLLDLLQSDAQPDVASMPFVAIRGTRAERPIAWEGKQTKRSAPSLNPNLDHYLRRGGMLNLQTKRGCPFRCVYCTYPALEGRELRLFDPQSLGKEARTLQDAGARYIFITDSAFNAHPDHSLAVARAFKEHGLTIPWGAYFAPRHPPTDDYYDELAACGLTHAEFGTDVLSESMLVNVGKAFSVKDVLAAQSAATKAGVHTAHFMLLGGPGESMTTIDETLDNCERLEGAVLFFFCGMRIYPNTPLFERALAEGQITADQNLLEPVFYKPSGLTDDDILQRARDRAKARPSWVVGSGGDAVARLVARMHLRGHVGPLWEKLAL
jgi:radical SAM superfamily enzyme YgiQ (UPF0313 family)